MSEKSDALKYAWWVEDEKVALVYADTTNTEDSYSSPSVVKTVTISGRFLPDAFVSGDTGGTNETGMTEECSLPKEFHDAIVNKAIQTISMNFTKFVFFIPFNLYSKLF